MAGVLGFEGALMTDWGAKMTNTTDSKFINHTVPPQQRCALVMSPSHMRG